MRARGQSAPGHAEIRFCRDAPVRDISARDYWQAKISDKRAIRLLLDLAQHADGYLADSIGLFHQRLKKLLRLRRVALQ
jgi:hypothetical protein